VMEGDRKGVPGQLVLISREDQQMAHRLVRVTVEGLVTWLKSTVMKIYIHHKNGRVEAKNKK